MQNLEVADQIKNKKIIFLHMIFRYKLDKFKAIILSSFIQ